MPDFPHVTSILARAGLIDSAWFTEESRDRGSALHAATHFLDEGDLDWDSIDPAVLARLRQYQKFLEEVRPEILSIEEPVVNEIFRYQGRLDRRVKIGGREGVLDIKGPYQAAWQAVQVAMYARCFMRPLARWTLHLSDDSYRLIEHKDRGDWNAALAALTLAAWKEAHAC